PRGVYRTPSLERLLGSFCRSAVRARATHPCFSIDASAGDPVHELLPQSASMNRLLNPGARETAESRHERPASPRTSGQGLWRPSGRGWGRARGGGRWIAVAGLAGALLAMPAWSAASDEAVEATRLVEKAQGAFLALAADPQLSALHALAP